MLSRYLLIISYDGSCFTGYQRQKNGKSVQSVLENQLSIILNNNIKLIGAGRTDAGVHALNQYAVFDIDKDIDTNKVMHYINKKKLGVSIRKLFKVKKTFHPRYMSIEKTYKYYIYSGIYNPFYDKYKLYVYKEYSLKRFKEAAKLFLGKHNFENFVAGDRENYEMVINKIIIKKINNQLILTFKAKSFYRYMVRNLVGAMLEYAYGNIKIEELELILDNKIKKSLNTANPCGLYLDNIEYKKGDIYE